MSRMALTYEEKKLLEGRLLALWDRNTGAYLNNGMSDAKLAEIVAQEWQHRVTPAQVSYFRLHQLGLIGVPFPKKQERVSPSKLVLSPKALKALTALLTTQHRAVCVLGKSGKVTVYTVEGFHAAQAVMRRVVKRTQGWNYGARASVKARQTRRLATLNGESPVSQGVGVAVEA